VKLSDVKTLEAAEKDREEGKAEEVSRGGDHCGTQWLGTGFVNGRYMSESQ
jgi:hypothetical protein